MFTQIEKLMESHDITTHKTRKRPAFSFFFFFLRWLRRQRHGFPPNVSEAREALHCKHSIRFHKINLQETKIAAATLRLILTGEVRGRKLWCELKTIKRFFPNDGRQRSVKAFFFFFLWLSLSTCCLATKRSNADGGDTKQDLYNLMVFF